jgi:hypothetical protein
LNYAVNNNFVVINKVYEAYHFRSRYPIFKSYIDNFYKKKAEAKDPLDRTINKLMLNSLYGIIGVSQSGEKFTAIANDAFDTFAEQYKVEDVVATTSEFTFFTYNPVPFNISNDAPENNKLIGSGLDRDIEPNPSNVVISAFISSLARIYMDKHIRSLWSSGVNVIYTDTF